MTCIKKQQEGHCEHSQCPFSSETYHGFDCIETIAGFCENGEGCLTKCEFSWAPGSKFAAQAEMAWNQVGDVIPPDSILI